MVRGLITSGAVLSMMCQAADRTINDGTARSIWIGTRHSVRGVPSVLVVLSVEAKYPITEVIWRCRNSRIVLGN